MRKFKTITALFMASVMLFLFTGCGKKIKCYDEKEINKILEDKLDIDDDDIHSAELERGQAPADCVNITTRYNDVRINVVLFEDADDAQEIFEARYKIFEDTFDQQGIFEGNYDNAYEDNWGYVVINGEDMTCGIFGDIFYSGPIYAGIYYTDTMMVTVTPDPGCDIDEDDINDVLEAFGFPQA